MAVVKTLNINGDITYPRTKALAVSLNSGDDLETALSNKQATLVSGTNIKTVNGSSIVGSGDLAVVADMSAAPGETGHIENKVGGYKIPVTNDWGSGYNPSSISINPDVNDYYTFGEHLPSGFPDRDIIEDIIKNNVNWSFLKIYCETNNFSTQAPIRWGDPTEMGDPEVFYIDVGGDATSSELEGEEINYAEFYLDDPNCAFSADDGTYYLLVPIPPEFLIYSDVVDYNSKRYYGKYITNVYAVYNAVNPPINDGTTLGGAIVANRLNNFGTITGSKTFALYTAPDNSVANHYYWTFDTSSTAPTITWPSGITWNGGSAPIVNANKHYEVSIMNNIGVFMEV